MTSTRGTGTHCQVERPIVEWVAHMRTLSPRGTPEENDVRTSHPQGHQARAGDVDGEGSAPSRERDHAVVAVHAAGQKGPLRDTSRGPDPNPDLRPRRSSCHPPPPP